MITNMISFQASVISHAGNKLYKDQSVLLDQLTSSSYCDMASTGDTLMIAPTQDASEAVRVFDGVQIRPTFATTKANVLLKCSCLCWFRQLMFAANTREINDSGVEERYVSRIRWSDTNAPENFNPWKDIADYQNFQDIGLENEPIIKMVGFKNNLYIFKRHSIWRAWGVSSPDGTLVGPEMIVEVHPSIGLISPNAVAVDEKQITFISDGGVYALDYYSDSIMKIVPELHDIIDKMDRAFWDVAVLAYSHVRKELYFAVGDHRKASDELYVFTGEQAWFLWKMPAAVSCIKEIIQPNGVAYTAVGDIDNGIGILDDRQRQDFGIYSIDSDYGTDWEELGYNGMKQLRSCELLMRVEGEFPVNLEVYHDLSQVPYETIPVDLSGTTFDPSIGAIAQSETDVARLAPAPANIAITADRDMFYPYQVDLGGSCRKVRLRIVSKGANARFKIAQIKIGYIRGTGI